MQKHWIRNKSITSKLSKYGNLSADAWKAGKCMQSTSIFLLFLFLHLLPASSTLICTCVHVEQWQPVCGKREWESEGRSVGDVKSCDYHSQQANSFGENVVASHMAGCRLIFAQASVLPAIKSQLFFHRRAGTVVDRWKVGKHGCSHVVSTGHIATIRRRFYWKTRAIVITNFV